MPNKSLLRARSIAFGRQSGRCLYCGVPMWSDDSTAFANQHGISPHLAKWLQCTAEHLHARCDGGTDAAKNIAAVCWLCNHRRHARRSPLTPQQYQQLVRKRVLAGRWHPPEILTKGLCATSA